MPPDPPRFGQPPLVVNPGSAPATSDIVDPFASESGDEEENEILIDAGDLT